MKNTKISVILAFIFTLFAANKLLCETTAQKLRKQGQHLASAALGSAGSLSVPALAFSIVSVRYASRALKEAERLEAATILHNKWPLREIQKSQHIIDTFYEKFDNDFHHPKPNKTTVIKILHNINMNLNNKKDIRKISWGYNTIFNHFFIKGNYRKYINIKTNINYQEYTNLALEDDDELCEVLRDTRDLN